MVWKSGVRRGGGVDFEDAESGGGDGEVIGGAVGGRSAGGDRGAGDGFPPFVHGEGFEDGLFYEFIGQEGGLGSGIAKGGDGHFAEEGEGLVGEVEIGSDSHTKVC